MSSGKGGLSERILSMKFMKNDLYSGGGKNNLNDDNW